MRIALFSDTIFPQTNGVANTVDRTARLLSSMGHSVWVFGPSANAPQSRAHGQGVYDTTILPSIATGIYKGERAALPFGGTIRMLKKLGPPDLVHAHTPFGAGIEAWRTARFFNVPLVGTHHTFFDHYLSHIHLNYSWAQKITWSYTAWYYEHCARVVSPTRSLAKEMQHAGLTRPVSFVPNPVDLGFFKPATVEQRRKAKQTFGLSGTTLLYLGRLSYEKSIDQALRAFALAAQKTSLSFLIVGDGPERSNLERLAASLDIHTQVRFTGLLRGDALREALHAADISVTASKSENMPLAILEALAVGLPIVAVGSLGLREIVTEEVGFCVAPDQPHELAEKILEVSTNVGLREKLSAQAATHAERYSTNAVGETLVAAYEEAQRVS